MKEVLFNNKTVQVPESWDDVSFSQFVELGKHDAVNSSVVATLLKLPLIEVVTSKDTMVYNSILAELENWVAQGVGEIMDEEANMIEYNRKAIEFGDVGECTVAQLEDCKILINKYQKAQEVDRFNALLEYYPQIVAVYFQPKAEKKEYDYSRAKKLVPLISDMPAKTVIGIVNFFLLQYVILKIGTSRNVPKANSPLKRLSQVCQQFIKRSVFRLYSTVLQREILKRKITLSV